MVSMIVSNDYINVGLISIPAAGRSEFEIHNGDETLYVLQGDLAVRTLEPDETDDRENASHMCHRVRKSEKMLIPEGIRHQYLNFTGGPVKIYFAVAPTL